MTTSLERWKSSLARTRETAFGRIANLLGASEINYETWETLEAYLVQADLGVKLSQEIIQALEKKSRQEGWTKSEALKDELRLQLLDRLANPQEIYLTHKPSVILIVGVNGSGKTTTIAKLAQYFKSQGKDVLLAAADTLRAAAIEQLQTWGERLEIRVIAGIPEGDPGAVAYDAVSAAVARKTDIVLIDTAGRLHTRYNLMEELKKIRRVAAKALPGAPHAVWLVLDATTGQNALQQARAFKETVGATAVILAKLDSSSRGGMAFAIQSELGLPIQFVGLGETIEDLKPFDRDAFVAGVLDDLR
jgi:fused signal recognition particle receptor